MGAMMSSSLIKIQEATASSSSSITLTGIDTTYNVYLVLFHGVVGSNDNVYLNMRSTVGGTADDSSAYEWAGRVQSVGGFANHYGSGQNHMRISDGTLGTGTSEFCNGYIWVLNANSSSQFTAYASNNAVRNSGATLSGTISSFIHQEAQTTDGVYFYASSGNIASGQFTIYGLNK